MRVLPCPLEVPPTRARRLGGAEEKNAGGGRTIGVWTRLFRGGGGRTLAHLFRGGGSKNYYLGDLYRIGLEKAIWVGRAGLLSSSPGSAFSRRGTTIPWD